jgi:glycosyltransferase involved in cell wall biosynthesis
MIKVLFVCYDLKDGGSPRVVSTLLNHMHPDLFSPLLVTYSDDRAYAIPQGIAQRVLGVKGGGGLFRKLAANLIAVFRLRRVLRQEQPEVAVGMGGITNWALILASKLTPGKTAIIIGEHGTGALEVRKDRATSNLIGLLNKFLYPLADRIVSISDGVREYLVQDLKLPEQKIVSITNPVDAKRIQQLSQEAVDHPWLVRKDKPVILWVGRVEFLKGLPCMISAFELVLRQIDARLIIVGEGSEQAAIRNLVEQRGLEEKVHFAGYQKNPYRYMPRADVFVFSSLGGEAFGLVLAEAMACGLPVVATDCVAGPREVLQNGRCGVLVPVGDEKALARGILSVLTDSQLREQLVSAGMQRAADFEPSRIVASYERLFREVSSNRRSGGQVADPR